MKFTLEDFLCNIQPFLKYENFERFHKELLKIPDLEESFQKELAQNEKWLDTALKSCDENGFHVSFLLDHMPTNQPKCNELALLNFCMGTVPTIKVTVYEVRKGWR